MEQRVMEDKKMSETYSQLLVFSFQNPKWPSSGWLGDTRLPYILYSYKSQMHASSRIKQLTTVSGSCEE